ncbi:hypothetical protein SAMN04487820_103330 [Actinopolyspora mzabensis]|uniref:Uncharacterized protein n=1 Tax=Actinopolyspora mzabensis TaxID=995066 RepID=A0A1G8YB03_ACTMZ|nr:hypothetical protein SAMN04487820_103330 [Actinopolyspora mzabensis]
MTHGEPTELPEASANTSGPTLRVRAKITTQKLRRRRGSWWGPVRVS